MIQRNQSASERLETAKLIRQTIAQAVDLENVQRFNGLRSLLNLLSQSVSDAVLEHVTFSLVWLLKHKVNSEVAVRCHVMKKLTHLLVLTENKDVQQAIIWCYNNLLQVDGITDSFKDEGVVRRVCNLIGSTPSLFSQLLVSMCSLLTTIAKDNIRNSDVIRNEGGIEVLSRLIGGSVDVSVKEQAVQCLEILVQNPRNRDAVRLAGGIASLCHWLQVSQNKQFVECALNALYCLVCNNKENVQSAMKSGLLQAINHAEALAGCAALLCSQLRSKLSEYSVGMSTVKECQHSNKSYKKIEKPTVKPVAVCRLSDARTCKPSIKLKPFVRWWQTKHSIFLTIQLRGVLDRQIKLTRNRIEFRSTVNEAEYELDMELFSDIICEKSMERVTGSQISLRLAKQEEKTWPRLLATTEKVIQIGIDFEHIDDAESDFRLPWIAENESSTGHKNVEELCYPPDEELPGEDDNSSDEDEDEDAVLVTPDEWTPF